MIHLIICDKWTYKIELIAWLPQSFSEVSVETCVESHIVHTERVVNLQVNFNLPDLLPPRKVSIFREVCFCFPLSLVRIEDLCNREGADWLLVLVELIWELLRFAKILRRSTNTIPKHIRQHRVVGLEVEVLFIAGVDYDLIVPFSGLSCLLWYFLLGIDLAKSWSEDVINLDKVDLNRWEFESSEVSLQLLS